MGAAGVEVVAGAVSLAPRKSVLGLGKIIPIFDLHGDRRFICLSDWGLACERNLLL
jgi:hypothetical protein